ncbi:unnamed protein product [Lasius platythorax]|uniref:Uncharacterized protein n=1 Tax=Lasius platythorax TaxID=488582 RepID=A0AAV2P1Y5_9HYME
MGHENAARKSLINLPNFPAVARWSRIKDQQMNRSVGGGKKEKGGNAGAHPGGRRYPTRAMNPSSPPTTALQFVRARYGRAFIVSTSSTWRNAL